jgi:cytoskeletal protein RodZ
MFMHVGKMSSTHLMLGLFSLLVIVLFIKPNFVNLLNKTILGRSILAVIIIYFANCNSTAGLLAVLVIVAFMQTNYLQEGLSNMDNTSSSANTDSISSKMKKTDETSVDETAVDETSVDESKKPSNSSSSSKVNVVTNEGDTASASDTTDASISELKAKIQELAKSSGTSGSTSDQMSVDPTRSQKSSNSLNTPESGSAENVAPSIKESFGPMTLKYSLFN